MTSGDGYEGEELLAPPRTARRRTWLLLAGAAVVVVVAVLVARRGHGQARPAALPTAAPSTSTGPSVSPSSSGPVGVDVTGLTNRQATIAFVDRWIAAVHPPPGADVVGVQATSSDSPAGPRSAVVVRERTWGAPGTIEGVIGYYQQIANWPDHLAPSGGTSDSVNGRHTSSGVLFIPPTSPAYTQPQIEITVTAQGGGVEVTAEASALVLPARTAAEHIPAGVTSVAVTLTRPGRATVRRTLTGAALRTITDLVNGQMPAPPAAGSPIECTQKPELTEVDRLSFVAPGHTIALRVTTDDCLSRAVRVTADGRTQPGLDGSRRIDRAVVAALGLPAAYRLH